MTVLDELLARTVHSHLIEMPGAWGQGRAVYGGLVAALMMSRLQSGVAVGQVLRAMSLSFVGPVNEGVAELHVEVLRQGKSVTHLSCRLLQEQDVRCVMLACFGHGRISQILLKPTVMPVAADPASLAVLPHIPGVMPEFTQWFDYRYVDGDPPFSNSRQGVLGGWIRLQEPGSAFSAAHLLALIDAWPPAVLPMYPGPAPISTMTWSAEFPDLPQGLSASQWFRYRADSGMSAAGYAATHAGIWTDQGKLLAISHQSIAVFR
ncbi:MAG: thioesterase family protein [Pseudomonadales bacterium]|nr:thioesterase family protein [Pseudomonadales bacterium]